MRQALTNKASPAVGKRLRDLRRFRGLKLREVSEATGLGISVICDIEQARRDVWRYQLERLARVYGSSPGRVLLEAEKKNAA